MFCGFKNGLPSEHRIFVHHLVHFLTHFLDDVFVISVGEHTVYESCDCLHKFLFRATGCDGSCAEAEALVRNGLRVS